MLLWGLFVYFFFHIGQYFTWNWSFTQHSVLCLDQPILTIILCVCPVGYRLFTVIPRIHIQQPIQRQSQLLLATSLDPAEKKKIPEKQINIKSSKNFFSILSRAISLHFFLFCERRRFFFAEFLFKWWLLQINPRKMKTLNRFKRTTHLRIHFQEATEARHTPRMKQISWKINIELHLENSFCAFFYTFFPTFKSIASYCVQRILSSKWNHRWNKSRS